MSQDPLRPDYARNMRILGHSDQGGRPDGVQIMVQDGFAYVGHMFSGGFSMIDVCDPRRPAPVTFVAAPPNTWSLHLQAHGDLLLVINGKYLYADPVLQDEAVYYSGSMADKTRTDGGERGYAAGIRIFDIADRANPREVSFLPIEGVGAHRIWYVGGRWAYASALVEGFIDTILLTIDLADPLRPRIAGRNWLPGMHAAAGETVGWSPERRYACHHAIVAGDTAYATWRDGGISLVDVSDRANPTTIVHRNWCPPYGGGTHNALPLPDRNLLVVVDEAVQDQCADGLKHIWLFDIREPTNPISIATMPVPDEADYVAKGAHFGPHNVHENRPGSYVSSDRIFATYQNAGVRVFDIRDPYRPVEVGALVPPAPARMVDIRPGRPSVVQTADIFVDRDGLIYATDTNAGLTIMEMTA